MSTYISCFQYFNKNCAGTLFTSNIKKKNVLKKYFLYLCTLWLLVLIFFDRRCLFVSAIMLLSLVLKPYWVTLLLFFPIFPTCVCVSFQLYFVHACAVENIAINNVPLKSIKNLSTVSEIDRIPQRKNCDRTVPGRISYFYYVTFPSFLSLYQAVDFKCVTLSLECWVILSNKISKQM